MIAGLAPGSCYLATCNEQHERKFADALALARALIKLVKVLCLAMGPMDSLIKAVVKNVAGLMKAVVMNVVKAVVMRLMKMGVIPYLTISTRATFQQGAS